MKLTTLLLFLVLTVGCIHKSGTVSPMERATTDNALFAQVDNSVEQGAEAVVTSGLVSAETMKPVIAWTGQIASIHEQITAILAKGTVLSAGDYTTIQSLLAQIQTSGTALINSGALGVKNPKSQQTIAADIQALLNLASAILSDLSALQSNPAQSQYPLAPALNGGTR